VRPLHLTFVLTLLLDITWTAPRMVFALYALALGATAFEVGILYAVLNLFPLLLSWPIGKLLDRVGPRLPLAISIVSGAAGLAIPWLVHSMAALYAGSALVGLAFSFFLVNVQNLVGVLSPPEKRAANFTTFSLIGASSNLIGPLIGGFSIDRWGHPAACLSILALSAVSAVLFAAWGRGLPGGTRRKEAASAPMLDILSHRALWPLLVVSSLVRLGMDLFQFYIPIYGHEIGLSASKVGSVLAVLAVSQFIVRFVLPHLIRRMGEEAMLVYSFSCAAAGFALAPFMGNAVLLGIACFVFGIGMGAGQPITTILLFNRSADGRSGETLGLRLAVTNLVRVAGPLVFGFVASAAGLTPVFLINAVMMGIGAVASRPRDRRRVTSDE
jgi:MFS family permease